MATQLRAWANPTQFGEYAVNAVLCPLLLDGFNIGSQSSDCKRESFARNWSSGWAGKGQLTNSHGYLTTLATLQTEIAAMSEDDRQDLVMSITQYKVLYCASEAHYNEEWAAWKPSRSQRRAQPAVMVAGDFETAKAILSRFACWGDIERFVQKIQDSVSGAKSSKYAEGTNKLDVSIDRGKRVIVTEADGSATAHIDFECERPFKKKKRDGKADTTHTEYQGTIECMFGGEVGPEAAEKFLQDQQAPHEGRSDNPETRRQSAVSTVGRWRHGLWCATQAAYLDTTEHKWAKNLAKAVADRNAAHLAYWAQKAIRDGDKPMKAWLETTIQPGLQKVYAPPPATEGNPGSAMDMASAMRDWCLSMPAAQLPHGGD